MFILVYVDDIIVASSSDTATQCLLKKLTVHFAIKDLGELHYFLGLEVSRSHGELILSQGKYATDLIAKVGLTQCSTCPTPLSTTDKLSLYDGSPLGPEDAKIYRSIVGALQYLHLHVLTYPSLLIRSVSFYMLPLLLIGHQLSAYYAMFKVLCMLDLRFSHPLLRYSVPFQMLTGQDVLMIDAPLVVLQSFLVQI
jgi:hypothetical protein